MRRLLSACSIVLGSSIHVLAVAGTPCGDWSVVPSPNPPSAQQALVRDVVAVAPDDVWAVGSWFDAGSGQSFGFALHWEGSSWTFTDVPQPAPWAGGANVTLWGVDATGPDDVWAAGHQVIQAPDGFVGVHVLVMHWDGDGWTVMETPVQSGASGDLIWGVEAITPDDVWFFGENLYPGTPVLPDLAIALHWDGSDFEFAPVPAVNPQTSGFGDGNGLIDGSALASDDIWAVGAASDGDSLPSDYSQIHHWDGEEWTPVPADDMPGIWHSLYAVEAIAPDDVWAGGEYFDGSAYHGLSLHWNGTQWTQVDVPDGIFDIYAFGTDDVWAVGGGVMHFNGETWEIVETFPEVDGPSLAGLDAAGSCDLWAGGRQFDESDKLRTLTVHLAPAGVPGDLDGDGVVGFTDLLILLAAWGDCPAPPAECEADVDGDGSVGFGDLLIVLAAWG